MAASLFSAGFRRNTADSTHAETGDVLEILVPGENTSTHSRQLHVIQAGDHGLDFNVAAQANPTLYLHSVTTPITDYLSIGGHDGTTATIDVVGGTTLVFAASGTTRLTMNAIGLVVANGNGILVGATSQVTGASVAELQVLGTAVADSSIQLGKWTTGNATGPEIVFIASNNATIGSATIVADDDVLGRIIWNADDGTDFANTAAIFQAEVEDGSPVANGIGVAFVWSSQIGGDTVAAEEHMRLAATGSLFLNQQAQDVAHFSLRSSDVTTGMSTINLGPAVTTNDYFSIGKIAGATGGAYLTSIAETSVAVGLHIESWSGQAVLTDTDTSLGLMNFFVGVHDDANGDTDATDDSNAFVWGEIDSGNVRRGRMLLKADDGELHLGNTTIAGAPLDNEDDILMIRRLQKGSGLMDGIVHSIYDEDLDNPFYDHAKLTELGVVSPKSEDGFYYSKLQPMLHLHEGAMWQMHNDMMGIAAVLSPAQRKKLPDRVQKRLALAGT